MSLAANRQNAWGLHHMETFSTLLALCEGNPPVTGGFPLQRPVTQSFDVFCTWTNTWANNWDAGDLRCHHGHYDVTAMSYDQNTQLTHWQNGRYFADNIFKLILLSENCVISIEISLKFIPKAPINNNRPLVQILAWRRTGAKPLSKPMLTINTSTASWINHCCWSEPMLHCC